MTPEEIAAKAAADAQAAAEATADAEAAKAKEETIGQVLETKEDKPEHKVVPEAAFLELKKSNKDLAKQVKALEKAIEGGASGDEVSANIEAIAEEFDVKLPFLKKLATAIRKDVEADNDERISAKLKPLEQEGRATRIEKVFSTHFDKAMADMPEFAGIVNRDVIKTLSLDPSNQNKTFAQLIEDTYGKALPAGKRTLESTTLRGGKNVEGIDLKRAQSDPKYYDELMADPDLKKEYNSGLIERLSSSL